MTGRFAFTTFGGYRIDARAEMVTARKSHACARCMARILRGETYWRVNHVFTSHPLCSACGRATEMDS
jgi:hypothetical protein